jgi:hypothetical protein
MLPRRYYVYAHYVDNKPVYIGKGKGKRHNKSRDYNDHVSVVLYDDLDETTALDIERWLINLIGIDKLRNKQNWNHVSGSIDIYKKATNSSALKVYERAASGDMEAILFIIRKIPDIFENILNKQQLRDTN